MLHYYKIGITEYKKLSKKDIISLTSYLSATLFKRKFLEKDFVKVCIKAGWLHMNLALNDCKEKYNYEMIKEVFGEKEFPDILDKLMLIAVSWLHKTEHHEITQMYETTGLICYTPKKKPTHKNWTFENEKQKE